MNELFYSFDTTNISMQQEIYNINILPVCNFAEKRFFTNCYSPEEDLRFNVNTPPIGIFQITTFTSTQNNQPLVAVEVSLFSPTPILFSYCIFIIL